MADPIVVSYYTGEPYRTMALEKLAPSCKRFGLERDIEEVTSWGSWERNVNTKPLFLLRKLAQHKDRDIIWLDADSEILEKPTMLLGVSEEFLIGAYYSRLNLHERPELWAGTLYLKNVLPTRRLVEEWVIASLLDLSTMDQAHLDRLVKSMVPASLVLHLPPEYHWIDYAMEGPLGKDRKPFIRHFHVARSRFMK